MNSLEIEPKGLSKSKDWRDAFLLENTTIQDAIESLDRVMMQIVLVVDGQNKLVGTVSDGDIRRGLLKGYSLKSPIEKVIFRNPLVVPETLQRDLVLQLMATNKIRQIPIVNEDGQVQGLHLWDHLAQPIARKNTMVIMAGGRGARMHPQTDICPKPMLKVAGKPMLEHIIQQARDGGFEDFIISLHYLGHIIEEHFLDGSSLDVRIQYLRETSPLGTAGALSLLENAPDQPLVITNGDVITDIRYGELLDFHERHMADATMAVRMHEWENPFGVVNIDGIRITGFHEKPVSRSHINAGVYVMSPRVLKLLARGEHCDMPTLFERARQDGLETIAYPMHEPWLDVGRPADLDRANLGKIKK